MKRKKLLSVITMLVLVIGLLCTANLQSEAADEVVLDGSVLTHAEESTGYTQLITRGVNLQAG